MEKQKILIFLSIVFIYGCANTDIITNIPNNESIKTENPILINSVSITPLMSI